MQGIMSRYYHYFTNLQSVFTRTFVLGCQHYCLYKSIASFKNKFMKVRRAVGFIIKKNTIKIMFWS